MIFLVSCDLKPEVKKTPLKLYVFDCGRILVKDISLFSPGYDENVTKKLTNSCYLIVHPKGKLLWDTGLDDKIGKEGTIVGDGAFALKVEKPLMDQLKEINVDPKTIDYLALSHFHFDHTGNANNFVNSTLIVQDSEYKAAFSDKAKEMNFNPDSYSHFANGKVMKLNGDKDLFGDGSVVIKSTPGHTPGHQSLFIDLPKTGPIVLSGDLYHFTKNKNFRRVPSFNFDKEQTLKSMDTLDKFVADKKAILWIQHDFEQNRSIEHSPNYYQ